MEDKDPQLPQSQSPNRNGAKSPSVASKIAASASSLAKDVIGASGGSDSASSLASASGVSGKSGESSRTGGNWSQTLPSRVAGHSGASGNHTDAFRSLPSELGHDTATHYPDHMDELSEFFNQDAPRFEVFEGSKNSPHDWKQKFRSMPSPNSDAIGFDYNDGGAVRALLSDPNFSTEVYSYDEDNEKSAEPTAADLFGEPLSETETNQANYIRSQLPPPPMHTPRPVNGLSLRPDFEVFMDEARSKSPSFDALIDGNLGYLSERTDAQILSEYLEYLGVTWEDVTKNYTDEVWGDMLPVVKESASDLERLQDSASPLDNKTVARLKMIIGHLAHDSLSTKQPSQFSGKGTKTEANKF